jgi:hypothetical protein
MLAALGSLWHFLVSWLFFGASQSMEDALCWMSSTLGAFGLALFGFVGAAGSAENFQRLWQSEAKTITFLE